MNELTGNEAKKQSVKYSTSAIEKGKHYSNNKVYTSVSKHIADPEISRILKPILSSKKDSLFVSQRISTTMQPGSQDE